jgi:ribosomal protein S18 acetylase RimI-like enzyme
MEIRPYKSEDKAAMQKIWIATSTIKGISDELLCLLYLDYYVDEEPQNAFVLVGDYDIPVGYILSAESCKQYISIIKEKYLKRIKQISVKAAFEMRVQMVLCKIVGKTYPAHLHINILPEVQRGGWGHSFIDTLSDHLKGKGVGGVQLVVGADNHKGVSFYKKYGFKKVANLFGKAYIFGIKF